MYSNEGGIWLCSHPKSRCTLRLVLPGPNYCLISLQVQTMLGKGYVGYVTQKM